MATIDEDLNQIERDVRTLKIEYEQFFGGGRSRPPTDTQWRVDTLVRRYAERVAELSSGQRFRYNNLTQTYAKYQDLWRKKLMQKEGAVSTRHFGAAAKAIEAQRAREDCTRRNEPMRKRRLRQSRQNTWRRPRCRSRDGCGQTQRRVRKRREKRRPRLRCHSPIPSTRKRRYSSFTRS